MEWDLVIGLEVHAQLKTQSKLFSGASTAFGATANSQACFIDAGLPGVLPVLNQQAVIMAIQLGLALNATINDSSVFERKNYFYPDLPKGYQISQYQKPIVSNGQLIIHLNNGQQKTVFINRAHLEEDAGKSTHDRHDAYTGIDLNRAGTPLLEIVTEPCLYSIEEAVTYLKTLHQLVRFLGICDGNMQEGSFRCDVNLSLKPKGSSKLGTRTELKNLNSFRFIEKAIAYEQARHQDILEQGGTIHQETRLYHPDSNSTIAMRGKENDNDYRYFPDPDLLPIAIDATLIEQIATQLPKLPQHIAQELKNVPELHEDDIHFVLSAPSIYQFYEAIVCLCPHNEKLIINWLKGPYAAALNERGLNFDILPISAKNMALLLHKLHTKAISGTIAKQIFHSLWAGEEDIESLLQKTANQNINNHEALENIINQIMQQHPEQVREYQAGKEKLLGFFVGQIMKSTKGQADPEQVNALLKSKLQRNGTR